MSENKTSSSKAIYEFDGQLPTGVGSKALGTFAVWPDLGGEIFGLPPVPNLLTQIWNALNTALKGGDKVTFYRYNGQKNGKDDYTKMQVKAVSPIKGTVSYTYKVIGTTTYLAYSVSGGNEYNIPGGYYQNIQDFDVTASRGTKYDFMNDFLNNANVPQRGGVSSLGISITGPKNVTLPDSWLATNDSSAYTNTNSFVHNPFK